MVVLQLSIILRVFNSDLGACGFCRFRFAGSCVLVVLVIAVCNGYLLVFCCLFTAIWWLGDLCFSCWLLLVVVYCACGSCVLVVDVVGFVACC